MAGRKRGCRMSDFTFDGFESANTTPVPDVLFDELLSKLTGAELKALLYIIRRTRGFKKEFDAISFTQFEKGIVTREGKVLDQGCGLSRETISKALAGLEAKGCIVSDKRDSSAGDEDTTIYRIRFKEVVGKSDYVGWSENLTTVVGKSDYRGRKSVPQVVGKSDLQDTVQDTVSQQTDSQEREDVSANASTPHASLDLSEKDGEEDTPLVAGGQFKQVVKGATGGQSKLTASDSGNSVDTGVGNDHMDLHKGQVAIASTPGGNGTQEKPKRARKKPTEVQLTLHEQEIKQWYEELRETEITLTKRNVTALRSLSKKKGTDCRENFLNVTALLDIDPWFEEKKIGVDLFWIDRQWENKYMFLQRKKPGLADKKPKTRPKPEGQNISIFEYDPSWQVWKRTGEDQEWIWWQGEFCTPEEADERGYGGGFGLYEGHQPQQHLGGVN